MSSKINSIHILMLFSQRILPSLRDAFYNRKFTRKGSERVLVIFYYFFFFLLPLTTYKRDMSRSILTRHLRGGPDVLDYILSIYFRTTYTLPTKSQHPFYTIFLPVFVTRIFFIKIETTQTNAFFTHDKRIKFRMEVPQKIT